MTEIVIGFGPVSECVKKIVTHVQGSTAQRSSAHYSIPPQHDRFLLDRISFPNKQVSFALLNVKGSSVRAPTRFHSNEDEANTWLALISHLLRSGVAPEL
ncbi:hypothetical protein OSTOST_06347 [Ostertagia ostertagi]